MPPTSGPDITQPSGLPWETDGTGLVDPTPALVLAVIALGRCQLAGNAIAEDIDVGGDGEHGEALLRAGLGLLAVRAWMKQSVEVSLCVRDTTLGATTYRTGRPSCHWPGPPSGFAVSPPRAPPHLAPRPSAWRGQRGLFFVGT